MRLLTLLPGLLLAAPAQAQNLAQRLQAAAKTGAVVLATEDVRNFDCTVKVARGRTLTLRAVRPVTLSGTGGEDGVGLRISSGGRVVIEGPITFEGFAKNCIRATLCESLTLRGCTFRKTGQATVLTGKCAAVRIEGCTAEDSASHGLYVSEGGSSIVLTGNTVRRCGSVGLHVNARPVRASNLTILDNVISEIGNSGIQVAAVTGAVIGRNRISRARQYVTVWDDGGGRRFRSERIDLRGQAPGAFNIARNSRLVLLPAGAGRATVAAAGVRRPAR